MNDQAYSLFWNTMLRNQSTIRDLALRYGRVMAIVVIAVVTRWALEPVMEKAGFAIFLSAVLIGAWFGGVGPSLFGQTILLLTHAFLFSSSARQASSISVRGMIGISVFYLVGTVVAVLSEARRSALKRVALQIEKSAIQDQQLQATISGIGDGVLVTDCAGRNTFINPVAETMTGWRESEALGERLESIFRPQETEETTGVPIAGSPIANVLRRSDSVGDEVNHPFYGNTIFVRGGKGSTAFPPGKWSDVTDGTSNVIMVAEKFVDPSRYHPVPMPADPPEGAFPTLAFTDMGYVNGWNWSTVRCSMYGPVPDQPYAGISYWQMFGSAHRSGVQALFGDGSVRPISYSIANPLFQLLCRKDDGLIVGADY